LAHELKGNREMAGFNKTSHRNIAPSSVLAGTGQVIPTHEGGRGFEDDLKTEFFKLAVTNFVGEDTYYESAKSRDARAVDLIHKLVATDPEWLAQCAAWLRGPEANMRSFPIQIAAEYARVGGPNPRRVINSVLQRADEPGEFVAYWFANVKRHLPGGVQRGVQDAVLRLYNEYAALKYDGQGSNAFRMGDVIELARPRPSSDWQNALFAYLLDRRHHASDIRANLDLLPKISLARELDRMSEEELRATLRERGSQVLADAGYTWERLGGKMKLNAEAWEAIIPTMGYMALLRNLRNFDEQNISASVRSTVLSRIQDPEQVAKSRQLPFRFLSAYLNAPGIHWGAALETALDLSTGNIPELPGRTLVLIDVSGSMGLELSRRSRVPRYRVGALFGVATAKKMGDVDVVAFGTNSEKVNLPAGFSVLRGIEKVDEIYRQGHLGYGTNAYPALAQHYAGHQRVVIFTDEQVHPYGSAESRVADSVPYIYTFNLAGYRPGMTNRSDPGRYLLGGFSDASFKMMSLLERGSDVKSWPWEN
jgi:hypothetical protein